MSMRDEPWEILSGQRRPRAQHSRLTPDEAQRRFGELRETLTDGLIPGVRYRTFEEPEGHWIPILGVMKELVEYKFKRNRR